MTRACSHHALIWIALLLVACSKTEEAPTPSDAPKRSRVPAPTWVASPEGVGPVKAGLLYADVARAMGAPTDRTPSGDYPAGGCDYTRLPGMPPRVEVMVFGDTIVRIDIDTVGVVTQEGLGVGSREVDLRAAFRSRVRTARHPYGGPEWNYVIVDAVPDSTFRMIFETDGERVRTYRVGRRDAVDLIEGCS